tara:strand:+ start:246 stop:506 length:261 start_codon:yes stop_codon:yes gene_type:complete
MQNNNNEVSKCEEGATAIEYGLIAVLIAVVIIGSVSLLGTQVSTTFNTVTGALSFVDVAGGGGASGGAGGFGSGGAAGSGGAGGFF